MANFRMKASEKRIPGIPKTLRVAGIDYKVILADFMQDDEGSLLGVHDFFEGWLGIDVCVRKNKDLAKIILLHEAIHAIDKHAKTGLVEEQIVALANGIYALLKNNPKVWRF